MLSVIPVYWRRVQVQVTLSTRKTHIERRFHMIRLRRSILAVLVLAFLAAGLSGCKKEGPMEKTGKEIDKAAEKTGDKIEKAGDSIKDAVKDLKK